KLEIAVQFLVVEEGYVERVHLIEATNNEAWNQAAVDSLLQWRFSHPPEDSTYYWVQSRFYIDLIPTGREYEVPASATYALVLFHSEEEALSLYQWLQESNNTNDVLESQDQDNIRYLDSRPTHYPSNLRRQLRDLRPGDATSPISFNGEYGVFIRLNNYK
ncbi:hypothetical protein QLX67_13410, partial [Balneolaceae bacterium ANBcel3]|nr:hypothetical protein [Balneolaceae bacterium ANBcel3]